MQTKVFYKKKDRLAFAKEINNCKNREELNAYKWVLERRPVGSLAVLISVLVAAFSVAMGFCTTPTGFVLQEDAQLYGHSKETLPILADAFRTNLVDLNKQLAKLFLVTIILAIFIYCGWRNHRNYYDFCIDTVKHKELQLIKNTDNKNNN